MSHSIDYKSSRRIDPTPGGRTPRGLVNRLTILVVATITLAARLDAIELDRSRIRGDEIPLGPPFAASFCLDLVSGETIRGEGIESRLVHLEPVDTLIGRARSLRLDTRWIARASRGRAGFFDLELRDGRRVRGSAQDAIVVTRPEKRVIAWLDIRAIEIDWREAMPRFERRLGTQLFIHGPETEDLALSEVSVVVSATEPYGQHMYRSVQSIEEALPFTELSPSRCPLVERHIPIERIATVRVFGIQNYDVTYFAPNGDLRSLNGDVGAHVRSSDAQATFRGWDELGAWTLSPIKIEMAITKVAKNRNLPEPPSMHVEFDSPGEPPTPAEPSRGVVGSCETWAGRSLPILEKRLDPIEIQVDRAERKVDSSDIRSLTFLGVRDPRTTTSCDFSPPLEAEIVLHDGSSIRGRIGRPFGWLTAREEDGSVVYVPSTNVKAFRFTGER